MHEIWDTSIFRGLGAGALTSSRLSKDGVDVWWSPASLLQVASRYSRMSLDQRKRTARAIADSGAKLLPDPETHLARDVFGFVPKEYDYDWVRAAHAMANSQSLEELQAGVAEFNAQLRGNVDDICGRVYRGGSDHSFVEDMLAIQKREIAGFGDWWHPDPSRRVGKPPRLVGCEREQLLADTKLPQFAAVVVESCRDRALAMTRDRLPWPPDAAWIDRLNGAIGRLEFHTKMYIQYVVNLLTCGMLPDANDWFDLEIMLYSSGDAHTVVTSEHKWVAMAEAAGMRQRIVYVGI